MTLTIALEAVKITPFSHWRMMGLLLAVLQMSGCTGTSPRWREEVKLPDNNTLVVERYLVYGNVLDQEFSDSAHGRPVKGGGMRVQLSSGRWTAWWHELGLYPLAVGRSGGAIYLATQPNLCGDYDRWGRPAPPYVYFRYDKQEWTRTTQEVFPENVTRANLAAVTRGTLNFVLTRDIVKSSDLAMLNRGWPDYALHIYRFGMKGFEDCKSHLESMDRNNDKKK